jgi:hypothetical protein
MLVVLPEHGLVVTDLSVVNSASHSYAQGAVRQAVAVAAVPDAAKHRKYGSGILVVGG